MMNENKKIIHLVRELESLDEGQLFWIDSVVQQFKRPFEFVRSESSDFVNDDFLQTFGDGLRIHHCFSREAFALSDMLAKIASMSFLIFTGL